jgi:hypothetical protein
MDRFNPDRDLTLAFLATVRRWILATGEVLVVLKYLRGGGAKDLALVTTVEAFDRLVDVCPVGTNIIVIRDPRLPLRGVVDDDFVQRALDLMAESAEYLFVVTTPSSPGDPRCKGEFDFAANLRQDLDEVRGETIALGACPDLTGPGSDSMISASRGGIDGPR